MTSTTTATVTNRNSPKPDNQNSRSGEKPATSHEHPVVRLTPATPKGVTGSFVSRFYNLSKFSAVPFMQ